MGSENANKGVNHTKCVYHLRVWEFSQDISSILAISYIVCTITTRWCPKSCTITLKKGILLKIYKYLSLLTLWGLGT